MLIVRREQMQALAAQARRAFARTLAAHCRREFPEVVEGLDEAALLREVVGATERARADYGLSTPQDLCHFVNLCALEGWGFDLDQAWTRSRFLENQNLSDPSDRIGLLVAEFQHRAAVAEGNRALREAFLGD